MAFCTNSSYFDIFQHNSKYTPRTSTCVIRRQQWPPPFIKEGFLQLVATNHFPPLHLFCLLPDLVCISLLNTSGSTRPIESAHVVQLAALLDLFSSQSTAGSHWANVKDVRASVVAVENILLPAASSRTPGSAAGQRRYILGGLRRPTCAGRRFSDCC